MSITIGIHSFDGYTGDIMPSKLRVESFARTDVAIAGAQVFPSAGRPFQIETWRYESQTLVEALKITLDGYIGTKIVLVDYGMSYAATYGQNFIVMNVQHRQWQSLIHARGVRNGSIITHTPAARLNTIWTLQATPT